MHLYFKNEVIQAGCFGYVDLRSYTEGKFIVL